MIINKDLFCVGLDVTGRFTFSVNGAFMYLKPEEMNDFRQALVEAIGEAERFYQDNQKLKRF